MAKTTKKNSKLGRGGRAVLWTLLALVMMLVVTLALAAINASTVHVRRATVRMDDLPPAFDGVKILYVSDVDLCGIHRPEKAAALMRRLQALEPDVLLLGGDYTSVSLFQWLNSGGDASRNVDAQLRARTSFFHYICDFQAPLGKYAVACPDDPDLDSLAASLKAEGIQPLFNNRAALEKDGQKVWLVGISDDAMNLNRAAEAFKKEECVIAAAYSPAAFPRMMIAEASDGGRWADLVLAGHTHGGQINVLGRSIIPLTSQESAYLYGWHLENGLPMLTTSGLGCEAANVRVGSQSEVWLITLRCKNLELPELKVE